MFELPKSTIVNKFIPKNSFNDYLNSKQRKLFTDLVQKIQWTNKLSSYTVNLPGVEVSEIQIFEIFLKQKQTISNVLDVIDKAIPYPIIFISSFENEFFLSAAKKHVHPTNENLSVVDWRFSSDWFFVKSSFQLNLKQNLDFVFNDFCFQLSGNSTILDTDINNLIDQEQKIKQLQIDISKLESSIKNCKQFNKKVELNILLKSKQSDLEALQ